MISIVTLTHNRAGLIGETIRSVLAQTETEYEYLVLDDGSEDDTASVVSGFDDSRISYVRLPHCGRLSVLRNAALQRTSGDFIAWIDSDDVWGPEHLRNQLAALGDSAEAGFVFTGVELFGPEGVRQQLSYATHDRHAASAFFRAVVSNRLAIYPSSLMFRRSCLEHTGGFDEAMTGGDTDFMMRLAFHFPGRVVPEILTRIRIHPGNHSASHAAEAHLECRATLHRLRDRGAIGFLEYRQVAAFHLRSAARHLRLAGRRKEARRLILESLSLNPAAWKSYRALFAVLGN
jgi:glycosyltransferase involved in cell wall biosynthesis